MGSEAFGRPACAKLVNGFATHEFEALRFVPGMMRDARCLFSETDKRTVSVLAAPLFGHCG